MKYLVNKETKEHRIAGDDWADTYHWKVVHADSEGWIPHTGNECPLPDDARCEYIMRSGGKAATLKGSGILDWSQGSERYMITRYRPILAEKVQEPAPIPAPQYDPRSVSFNLLDRLKSAHKAAQTIPDLEAELREVLAGMGYDLVARSPFANQCCGNPEQCWEPCGDLGKSEEHVAVAEPEPAVETPQDNKYAAEW